MPPRRQWAWITLLFLAGSVMVFAPPAPLHVEYDGCALVLADGPVCVLSPRSRILRLWVDLPAPTAIEIRVEDDRVRAESLTHVGSGQLLAVPIPSLARSIRLSASTREGLAEWSLNLAE